MQPESKKERYVCPPDAGPAWRAAYEAGHDMAELEENLKLTPDQPIEKHYRLLNALLEREHFLEKLSHGWRFALKQHVHSR